MTSVHASVRQHDIPPRWRDADACAKSGFGAWQILHRERNGVQSQVPTPSGDDNRHPGEGQNEPWIILTDLEPEEAGASWREMRFWIETGFNALKSVGWQWQKTRRTDPARVERHWPVLSAATLLTLAFGSRAEDANALKRSPSALRAPPKAAPERNRLVSVFRLGLATLSRLLVKGRMWRRARIPLKPWPPPPDGVKAVCHPEIRNLPL